MFEGIVEMWFLQIRIVTTVLFLLSTDTFAAAQRFLISHSAVVRL